MKPVAETPQPASIFPLRWYDAATDQPPGRDAVWGFCPDIGCEDEGWGYILPVMHESLHYQAGSPVPFWRDIGGERLRITRWAMMTPPEVPEEWIESLPPEK